MDGQTLLTIVLALLVLIWLAELVLLFRSAEQRRDDPFRVVSGAAVFFVAAYPVAMSNPGLVDRVGDFWGRLTGSGGGNTTQAHTPARILLNGEQSYLDQPRTRIGRYPNNEIVLDHSTVSAYHAEIVERSDGRHEIIDRESRNGTRVNGALVRNQILRDGDLITLGAASMHYLSDSTGDSADGPINARREPARYEDEGDYPYDNQ